MKIFLLVFYCMFSTPVLYAQNPEWMNYTNGQSIRATAIEGDAIWIGTEGGLVKFNKTTGEKIFLTKMIQACLIILSCQ